MTFHLQIVTPDGLRFDGQADRIILPTTNGQIGILARHINFVTSLGMGQAKLVTESGERYAACIGGMVAVTEGEVKVVATTFEWADEIDVARANASLDRAVKMLADPNCDKQTRDYALARQKRAQVRLSAANRH